MVFEMYEESVIDGETVATELPTGAIVDAVLRITALKRHVDLISHYGTCDYAILLPNTKSTGARIFAQRVIDSLLEKPLGDVNPDELCLAFGCASIPEDFVDMSKLLGAAELALDQAHATGAALVMYTDIKDRVQVPE
jgi:GGDEF domain-containing protein